MGPLEMREAGFQRQRSNSQDDAQQAAVYSTKEEAIEALKQLKDEMAGNRKLRTSVTEKHLKTEGNVIPLKGSKLGSKTMDIDVLGGVIGKSATCSVDLASPS